MPLWMKVPITQLSSLHLILVVQKSIACLLCNYGVRTKTPHFRVHRTENFPSILQMRLGWELDIIFQELSHLRMIAIDTSTSSSCVTYCRQLPTIHYKHKGIYAALNNTLLIVSHVINANYFEIGTTHWHISPRLKKTMSCILIHPYTRTYTIWWRGRVVTSTPLDLYH